MNQEEWDSGGVAGGSHPEEQSGGPESTAVARTSRSGAGAAGSRARAARAGRAVSWRRRCSPATARAQHQSRGEPSSGGGRPQSRGHAWEGRRRHDIEEGAIAGSGAEQSSAGSHSRGRITKLRRRERRIRRKGLGRREAWRAEEAHAACRKKRRRAAANGGDRKSVV